MASSSGVGSRMLRLKNSITPITVAPCSTGTAEGRVQANLSRDWRARKIRVAGHVGYPRRLARRPDAAGQADPGANVGSCRRAANSSNGQRRRLPHADALEHVAGAVDFPQGAVLPAEALADRPEHPRHRLDQRGRFRQDARGFVEDPLVRALAIRRRPGRRAGAARPCVYLTCRSTPVLHYGFRSLGAAMATDTATRRILIVDDDRALRHVLGGAAQGCRPHRRSGGGWARRAALARRRRLRHRAARHRAAGRQRPRRARARARRGRRPRS